MASVIREEPHRMPAQWSQAPRKLPAGEMAGQVSAVLSLTLPRGGER